jgi:hypothetical protein
LGNNLCAVDNSISVGFIVIRIITFMMNSKQSDSPFLSQRIPSVAQLKIGLTGSDIMMAIKQPISPCDNPQDAYKIQN